MMVRAVHRSQPEYPATFGGNPKMWGAPGDYCVSFRSLRAETLPSYEKSLSKAS
jgi:hypothetical protein